MEKMVAVVVSTGWILEGPIRSNEKLASASRPRLALALARDVFLAFNEKARSQHEATSLCFLCRLERPEIQTRVGSSDLIGCRPQLGGS